MHASQAAAHGGGCAGLGAVFSAVYHDMHDGDYKQVTLGGGLMTIVPHGNSEKWVVKAPLNTKCAPRPRPAVRCSCDAVRATCTSACGGIEAAAALRPQVLQRERELHGAGQAVAAAQWCDARGVSVDDDAGVAGRDGVWDRVHGSARHSESWPAGNRAQHVGSLALGVDVQGVGALSMWVYTRACACARVRRGRSRPPRVMYEISAAAQQTVQV